MPLVDAFLDGHGQVAAEGALHQQQEDHAAVQNGEGQQVNMARLIEIIAMVATSWNQPASAA